MNDTGILQLWFRVYSVIKDFLQALGFTWASNNGHLEVARLPRERRDDPLVIEKALGRSPEAQMSAGD